MWHCCATSDCTFQSPLGSNCLSHSGAHKHLKTEHDIVGQQSGTAAAKHNAAAACLVVEAEGTQIGAPRVKNLNIALLLITACLSFVHVESPHFRFLADVNISAQNARRFVAEIYLSIVETIRGVIKKVVDTSMGLKMCWWNADLWTCPSNGKKNLGVKSVLGQRKTRAQISTIDRYSVSSVSSGFQKGEEASQYPPAIH